MFKNTIEYLNNQALTATNPEEALAWAKALRNVMVAAGIHHNLDAMKSCDTQQHQG